MLTKEQLMHNDDQNASPAVVAHAVGEELMTMTRRLAGAAWLRSFRVLARPPKLSVIVFLAPLSQGIGVPRHNRENVCLHRN
jgi:hypothetical protein